MTPLDPNTMPLSGTSLVEASAGTGKTFTIATLYLRLIVESSLQPGEILVVTFTRAATAELRDRLRRRLHDTLTLVRGGTIDGKSITDHPWLERCAATGKDGVEERLEAALRSFDEAAIFTIHGFCQRVLHENAFESGAPFDVETVSDQSRLLGDVVHDFWVRELHAAPLAFLRCLKTTPDTLAELLNLALAHPQIRLAAPAAGSSDDDDADAALAAFEAAHTTAAAVWRSERAAILEALGSKALDGNKYRRKSVQEKWPPQIDALFAEATPDLIARFDAFEKLTPSGLAAGTKKGHSAPEHSFFDLCAALLTADARLVAAFDRREQAFLRRAFTALPDALRERKRQARVQSFDDLLHGVARALAGPTGAALATAVRGRFRAALIDEFQDTDPVQCAIFRRIYAGTDAPLVFVGDPKQAIYSFRGADVDAYLDARKMAGGQTYTLARNWRSDPRLLDGLNAFFTRAENPFATPAIAYEPVQPKPGAVDRMGDGTTPALCFLTADPGGDKADGERFAADATAGEIVRLLAGGESIRTDAGPRPVLPADIAVLCRTNRQAELVRDALRERRVPAVLQTQQTVFEVAEAGELLRVLQAMAEPRDAARVRAALATSLVGADAAELDRLIADETAWEAQGQRFLRLHARWQSHGFMAAFESLRAEVGMTARLLAGGGGERRLTDVLHLAELVHGAEVGGRLQPQAVVRWLAEMCSSPEARSSLLGEAAHIRLETDADAVALATIHRSKGLEYPVVFCPFLWTSTTRLRGDPALRTFRDTDEGELRLSLAPRGRHPEGVEASARQQMTAEDRRLLYVALTRAKHRCFVVWGGFRGAEDSPLAHFLGDPVAGRDAAIANLAAESGGAIGHRPLPEIDTAVWAGQARPEPQLAARQALRRVRPVIAQSSFSSMIRSAVLADDEAEGVDRDAVDIRAGSDSTDDGGGTAPGRRIALDTFPGGRSAGDFFHKVFEKIDFATADAAAIRRVAAERLPAFSLDADLAGDAATAVEAVLRTELPHDDGTLRLDAIAARDRLAELDFLFPVRGGDDRADSIAAAFAGAATHAAVRAWAEGLGRRRIAPLHGHLRGFIDLTFRHDRRWYVADYKSNHLGPEVGDYDAERLAAAMTAHDYFLQYHLYVVGLVRHLRLRVPGFDYERDFGGVYYLFLRGIAPSHPRGSGVFFDRPPQRLITALDAALSGDRP